MNDKLTQYILQQKALNINNKDIKKQLLNGGWNEKDIDSALNSPLDKEKGSKKLQISLIVVGLLIFLGLVFNLVFTRPYNSFIIDPSIKNENEALFVEIETQEEVLHNVLHSDLKKGSIPISKELAVLFRLADLLHLQNELIKISDTIDILKHATVIEYNPVKMANMVSEIKNIQKIVATEVNDKTHDGTLDPTWFINH